MAMDMDLPGRRLNGPHCGPGRRPSLLRIKGVRIRVRALALLTLPDSALPHQGPPAAGRPGCVRQWRAILAGPISVAVLCLLAISATLLVTVPTHDPSNEGFTS